MVEVMVEVKVEVEVFLRLNSHFEALNGKISCVSMCQQRGYVGFDV